MIWILDRCVHSTTKNWESMKTGVIQSCPLQRGHFSHTRYYKTPWLQTFGAVRTTCPNEACVWQPSGQYVVWHPVRLNSWILLLPWEHHHDCSLSAYARELRVPTDSNWSWRPQIIKTMTASIIKYCNELQIFIRILWTNSIGILIFSLLEEIDWPYFSPTDLMEQHPYGDANSHLAAQKIPCFLLDMKVHYHIHKSPYFRS